MLDGLAGFLTDSFVKRFLGNNEARYRRYKVCFPMRISFFTIVIDLGQYSNKFVVEYGQLFENSGFNLVVRGHDENPWKTS